MSWFRPVRKGRVTVEIPDDRAPDLKPIEDLRAQVEELEERLRKRKIADAELIAKPSGTYRIVRIEAADGPSGYFVQRWRVEQNGYTSMRQGRFGLGLGLNERYVLEGSLDHETYCGTEIVWFNVGASNPHATHEDAADWLRKWLRPEVYEVHYDGDGAPVTTEAQVECDGASLGRPNADAGQASGGPS